MVYKGFLRKKNTIFYIIIYTLLMLGVMLLFLSREHYINKENDIHKNDFLLIQNKKNIDINKMKNVESYKNAIYIKEPQEVVILEGNNLKDNEVIVSDTLSQNENDNSLNIVYKNKIFKLKIKEISKDLKIHSLIVNEQTLKEIENNKEEYYYALKLKNWLNCDKTIELLQRKYKINPAYYINSSSDDYKEIFKAITIFLIVFLLIFLVIEIITTYNIIEDEQRNNKLYKIIGYKKMNIIFITIKKILMVLIISIALSVIIFTPIKMIIFK